MPVKFEWQTDKEHEWTDENDPIGQAFSWRRYWRIWLALALLLVLALGISFALLNRRAVTTENTMANDVQSSHQLVQQAIVDQDAELFALMLFPYDRDWSELQQELFDRRLFLDRVPLGLWAAPHLVASEPVVTMAPDMQTAVITTQIPTIIEKSPTMTETIMLEHTAVYQRDDSQWLLASPPDSFWGGSITEIGNLLTLTYPVRDEAIGRRLIVDLDKALEALCQLEGVGCLPSFNLRLTLETDFAQILALKNAYDTINPRRVSGGALSLTLPAPTLVGRPVDEAGYQAVMRGYAGWITAVLVNEFNRLQQPDHAAITRQLAQIDLQPPPLNRERPWQYQAPPPIPWPEQDILLHCRVNNLTAEVWRYELAESNWVDETAVFAAADPSLVESPNGMFLLSMPDDDGAVALSFEFGALINGRVFLWQDGAVIPLVETVPAQSWLPSSYILPGSVQERFLVFYQSADELADNYTFGWLDLAHCPGPACQLQTGDALPLWSPDGQKTVLSRTNADVPIVSLGDAHGVETADTRIGWSPVWVDDAAFAYFRPDSALGPIESVTDMTSTELMLAEFVGTAVSPTEQSLLTSADLFDAMPGNGRPDYLIMYAVIAYPARPDQWFIQATSALGGTGGQDYLFGYDRESGDVSLVLSLDDRFQGTVQVEGNGRFLATTSMENNTPVYLLHDLQSRRTTTYPFAPAFFMGADWSANGDWLVMMDGESIRLIAPGSGYERPIFHGVAGCGTAVWVNK